MDAHALHLAMAALIGASFVAVSAYYMHQKTLTQLLEFAKTIDREQHKEDADEELVREDKSPQHLKKRRSHTRRKGNGHGHYRRLSSSLPDVTAVSGYGDYVEHRDNGHVFADVIPAGLPKLSTLPEGELGLMVLSLQRTAEQEQAVMHFLFRIVK